MTRLEYEYTLSPDSVPSLIGYETDNEQEWPIQKWRTQVSSCRICLSNVFHPAALDCGHQFCEHCLNQYWKTYEKPDHIVCPLCRTQASNVCFLANKTKSNSTHDFRKMFDRRYSPTISRDLNKMFNICLKISAVAPAVYIMIKFLLPVFKPFIFL